MTATTDVNRNKKCGRKEKYYSTFTSSCFPSDPPDRVTLSVSPAGNIVRGSSVVLTCSGDARPPVGNDGYSLYREGGFVSFGQEHTILDVQTHHSGLYHCRAWNNISRRGVDHFISNVVRLQVYCTYVDINSTARTFWWWWWWCLIMACVGFLSSPRPPSEHFHFN